MWLPQARRWVECPPDQSEESWLKVGGAKGVDELKGCRGQDKMHFNKYGNESSSGTLLEFKNKDMELKIE